MTKPIRTGYTFNLFFNTLNDLKIVGKPNPEELF